MLSFKLIMAVILVFGTASVSVLGFMGHISEMTGAIGWALLSLFYVGEVLGAIVKIEESKSL